METKLTMCGDDGFRQNRTENSVTEFQTLKLCQKKRVNFKTVLSWKRNKILFQRKYFPSAKHIL